MKQNDPTFGKVLDRKEVAEVLNIDASHIDNQYPIQEVSTGLPVILVPLKSLAAVKNVKINKEKYFQLIAQTEAKAIMVFISETYKEENHLNVRDFAEYYGIPEDAATGSSNGCLAAYVTKHRYFGKEKINLHIEQGYEMNRPSLLHVRAEEKNHLIEIFVGGEVTSIANGKWNV